MSVEFATHGSALKTQHGFLMAPLLLQLHVRGRPAEGRRMTKAQWLLLGAALLGVAIVVYFVFLCPTECH